MRHRPPHLRIAASDGKLHSGAHHESAHHESQQPYVSSLGLNPAELLTLQILRHLCDSFATQETGGWEKAHLVAEGALPTGEADWLVAKSVALLRAIRRERPGRFGYISADCPTCSRRISEDEQTILLLIRAAQGDAFRLRELTLDFSIGHECAGICASLTELGEAIAMIGNLVEQNLPSREGGGVVVLHPADGGRPC